MVQLLYMLIITMNLVIVSIILMSCSHLTRHFDSITVILKVSQKLMVWVGILAHF